VEEKKRKEVEAQQRAKVKRIRILALIDPAVE
jgi:hypothetical protein